MQVPEVGHQVPPVVLPRHPVHPRCGLRAQRPVGQAITSRSRPTWCSSAVNRASLSLRAAWRTRSSALSAPCPALCPGRVLLAVFPLASPLSSPASAAAALLGGFAGTAGLSDSLSRLRERLVPGRHVPLHRAPSFSILSSDNRDRNEKEPFTHSPTRANRTRKQRAH